MMTRDWKSVVGVLLVFALGGLAGASLSLILAHHRITTVLRRGSPAYEQLLERRLSHGLHLSDDQRSRFHRALVSNIEQRKTLQKQLQPQVQVINQQTREEIRGILSAEQLATLRQNLQEFKKRFGAPGMGESRLMKADANESVNPGATTNVEPATNAAPQ